MDTEQTIFEWRVPPETADQRLDKYVAQHLGCPRNRVQRWLKESRVHVDGKPAKAGTTVQPGRLIRVEPPTTTDDERVVAENGPLDVVFEDSHLVVIHKPPGLAVHPGAGRSTGTLANHMIYRYPEMQGVGGPGRPGIVHRLDLDTTGVMVVARTDEAYLGLSEAFAKRRVGKTYQAVAHGTMKEARTVEEPIGRHPRDRKKMTIRSDGKPAISHIKPLAVVDGAASVVEIDLETGRTHQIRVHLKHIRHPLVGDPVYGEARWKGAPTRFRKTLERFPRPALHARRLRLDHPISGETLIFEAPVPEDLIELWRKLSKNEWPT